MIERIRELLRGDREKPGAKEGGGADLALLCPPEPLSRWIPPWAPKQKQSSLAPGFSRSLGLARHGLLNKPRISVAVITGLE